MPWLFTNDHSNKSSTLLSESATIDHIFSSVLFIELLVNISEGQTWNW